MGLFLDVFVIAIAIMLILFLVTQLFYPMYTGEPLFPLLGKSAVKEEIERAEIVLEEVAEIAHLKKVETQIKSRLAELEKKE